MSCSNIKLSLKQKVICVVITIGLLLMIAYCFFDAMEAVGILAPLGILFYSHAVSKVKEKEQRLQKEQLKELLIAMSNNLSAGYSLENAFITAGKELSALWGDKKAMSRTLMMFANRLSLGENFDQLFREFSLQLSEKEMLTFTHMIAHAKISGGDLVRLFKQQSWQFQEKQMVLEESMTLISGKKYEYQIMVLMPIAIILYMRISSIDIMNVLYTTVVGRVVMSIALILNIVAYYWGMKIVSIKV